MKLPAVLGLLFGVAASVPAALAVDTPGPAPCYMAFVHGSGESHHDDPLTGSSPGIDAYWMIDGRKESAFFDAMARRQGCVTWRVGYDGVESWWSRRAAGRVAASLTTFIAKHDIPDGGMTLVGHSMGGLVVRYVINSGMPAAPFYNEYIEADPRMDYDLVRRKTARVIALQAPLAGTQSADALFGQADHAITNSGASVIKILGWRDVTPAVGTMTRSYMEAAGSPGGEMGDEGRQVPLYTVAGYDSGDASGTGTDNDSKLGTAWVLLCYRRGASNSWGAACRWDVWNFVDVPGDGLVEHTSAHGRWIRGSANGRPGISGTTRPYLDTIHNHNHGRYDWLSAGLRDFVRGGVVRGGRLATYIGDNPP